MVTRRKRHFFVIRRKLQQMKSFPELRTKNIIIYNRNDMYLRILLRSAVDISMLESAASQNDSVSLTL